MEKTNYFYNAKIINIVDGDTVDMIVDLGFHTFVEDRFRLSRIDTPEMNSKVEAERLRAQEAKAWLMKHLNTQVTIESFKKDKYGRYLAEIYPKGVEISLNQNLLDLGLAKIYT